MRARSQGGGHEGCQAPKFWHGPQNKNGKIIKNNVNFHEAADENVPGGRSAFSRRTAAIAFHCIKVI